MLNVLLVAGSARFSTRDVWDGYRVALQDVGVNVVPYSTFSFLRLLSVDAVCNDIIGTAVDQSNGFDFVIFTDGLYFRGQRARVPQSIRRAGIPTVLIATDDPYETIPHTETLYTHRFSNEINGCVDGIRYLPTATLKPPPCHEEVPDYDLSFVGTVFEDRLPTMLAVAQHCEQNQRRFLIAGKLLGKGDEFERFQFTDTMLRTIPPELKWEIYGRSRLTLNLFRESEKPAASPSPRVFEVTAFGKPGLVTGPERAEVTQIFGDSVYRFDTTNSLLDRLGEAWADEEGRLQKVDQARQVCLRDHTYAERVSELLSCLSSSAGESTGDLTVSSASAGWQHDTAWLIGCGRTGSTWLAEMLGDLPAFRRWHEPYYGRFFKHLQDRPDDVKRPASFFSEKAGSVWSDGLRDLFYTVAKDRFPQLGQHALVVKEVNTPEFYRWIRDVFPHSKMILLIRDPFDILDSYLALQQPGSWNQHFGDDKEDPLSERNVRRTAKHIHSCLSLALAAFEVFPKQQKLWVTYESLLEKPVDVLVQIGELMNRPFEESVLSGVQERHRFENYKQTGPLAFRRQGRAGGWTESTNFTGEVHQWAGSVLGDLRLRLGYGRLADEGVNQSDETSKS